MIPCTPYGNFRTKKFTDIFADVSSFKTGFAGSIFTGIVTTSSLEKIYYLLYAKYGNSRIANSDENQFKYKVYSLIWQYGPTWEKNIAIQASLRNLTEAELITGSKQINSHAYNPSTVTESGPNPTGEIDTVNEQTKSQYVKPKMDAYAMLISLLEKDVTEEFLSKFKRLFLIVVEPPYPLFFESEN